MFRFSHHCRKTRLASPTMVVQTKDQVNSLFVPPLLLCQWICTNTVQPFIESYTFLRSHGLFASPSTTTSGLTISFPPFRSPLVNPSISPTIPPGFGTGHSCPCFSIRFLSSANLTKVLSPSSSSLRWFSSPRLVPLRRLSRSSVVSTSASTIRGAGQGMMCGMPTTMNETRRVAPKREVVRRERG